MGRMRSSLATLLVGAAVAAHVAVGVHPRPASGAEPDSLPYYLYDRGDGIPTSIFGTYVRKHELLVYSFYEYTLDRDAEYKPKDLRFTGPNADRDFFGRFEQHEYLVFLAYAFTDWFAVEFESAVYTTATLEKARSDTSTMPNRLREDGLGDTEINLRLRWFYETEYLPEGVAFFKTVFPIQENKRLIGTRDWELSPGLLFVKGTRFGTFTGRVAGIYNTGEKRFEFDGYGVDYLKRLSPDWRVVLSLEGTQDEHSIIGEVQYWLTKNIMLKLNSGFGLTKKAPDYAPEVGILFSF